MQPPASLTPGASFEQPFELLGACHERVERTLALLARLCTHLAEHGCDDQAQMAARDVLRYFDIAAPLHHQDEELHVFPPLLASANHAVQTLVRTLQAEHRQMEMRWQAVRAALLEVAQGNPATWQGLATAQRKALDDFAALYRNHMVNEEQVAYPAAQALLTEDTLRAMGADMMHRRGVTARAKP